MAGNVIQTQRHKRLLFAGELALNGRIRPVRGVINLAILGRGLGIEGVVVPVANGEEAAAVGGIEVYPADSLSSVVAFLNDQHQIEPLGEMDLDAVLAEQRPAVDFADVRGQQSVKRALMIAEFLSSGTTRSMSPWM